ncbi:TOBE domain-containing protein, partial [Leucobacter sp. USHLN153]|uniref:TOBE domain-containing protein n=1 Tax=Leucobacter sp. USHLN153 TaxID=3081268 RepID=UPI0030197900
AENAQRTALSIAGHRVVANGTSTRDDLAILIRPENLSLKHPDEPINTASHNALPVTITDVTYLGASRRYTVELPDGTEGTVRAGQEARVHNRGDRVQMSWEIASGVLLIDTGEAGESTT